MIRIWKLSNAGLQRLDVDHVVAELLGQLLQSRDALILDDLLPIAHACTTPAPRGAL